MVMRSGSTPAYCDVRLVSGMPWYRPSRPGGPGLCSTVTATLRISRPSSGGRPSSAAATISSKRPGSTSITSLLCNVPKAAGDPEVTGLDIAMPLSTNGRFIVDAHGKRVRLAGVNWYGFHEDLGVAPGLDRTHRSRLAKTIVLHGFNSVRLPFSLWMTQQTEPVPDEYLAANPDLSGMTPIQVYDACVEALTGAGLIVIPNCHLLDAGDRKS